MDLISTVGVTSEVPEELAERARATGSAVLSWSADGESTTCAVGWPGERPALSRVLPLFEQLGLELRDHRPSGVPEAVADIFDFQPIQAAEVDRILPLLGEGFLSAWEGRVDADDFAVLVPTALLRPRQVQLVRAAFHYLRQAGLGASHAYVRDILVANSTFVRHWVEVFEARFDPGAKSAHEDLLAKYVDAATTRDEFRVLQWYAGLGQAVVRTNYFRAEAHETPGRAIVLKLDPKKLPFATDPAVAVETFVHHPDVEGLHVRYGPVARGGVRWSDRIEDYRDEVLALAKAQQVKNSLIVPAGAKGAFVVKVPLTGLDAATLTMQVRRCYRIFVRGLLDVTDNVVDGLVRPPSQTVCLDAPDPYLVVAADKGTAAFSDLANAEAAEAGFWLDDAFASGGSRGFDHKALGVTARGAWVAVRRHLGELGLDPDRDEFTVVGIGDMSGDVFGNGMLLSDRIQLVAAFDYRHLFLDPDPEPLRSHEERARLAGLPGSSWADYDPGVISSGGGVFARSARSVHVSPEAARRLGVVPGEHTPDDVVRAILCAPVDLLWNGGIGTYVRASSETDVDVSDRANDRVRVAASEMRCRIVGEGGNLGLTQAARVEYATLGGRVNADFIDNAAGVNTSDREVNLKILLASAMRAGLVGRDQRDRVLQDCAPTVVDQVLADNDRQVLAISIAESYGPTMLDRHEQVIENLTAALNLDRRREHLPDAAEIAARRARARGLTRPEIAVILAHAKNRIHQVLLNSDIPDDDSVAATLLDYFPASVNARFEKQVRSHELAREIIAARLANDVIDRVGPGFLYRVDDRTGASTDQAVRAFLVVRDLLGLETIWRSLADHPVAMTVPVRDVLERALENNICWLLRRRTRLSGIHQERATFAEPVGRLRAAMIAQEVTDPGSDLERCLAQLTDGGASEGLLTGCRAVSRLHAALALASAADLHRLDVLDLAAHYSMVSNELNLSWLSDAIPISPSDSHWTQLAKSALRDELSTLLVTLAGDVLRTGGLRAWTRRNRAALERARSSYAGLSSNDDADIAMLTVGVQVLRDLSHAVEATTPSA
jgi:glutamate dehydrogenase